VDHEIAEQRGKQHRYDKAEQDRDRALADVDDRERVGVAAETEERGLSKREDAAEAPDEGEAQRQDREDAVDGDVDEREQLDDIGHADQRGDSENRDRGHAHRVRVELHIPPRNSRPVMPAGKRRSRMIAAASSATSPTTGVARNVTTWFTAPSSVAAEAV